MELFLFFVAIAALGVWMWVTGQWITSPVRRIETLGYVSFSVLFIVVIVATVVMVNIG